MSQWQIVSLIALLGYLVLAINRLRARELDADIVMRSILTWGAIVAMIVIIVVNLDTIRAVLAPARAMMP